MAHLGKNIVIAAALLGAGFAIAWLRFRPYLGDSTELTDGSHRVATDSDSLRYAMFDAPAAWQPDADPSLGSIDSAPTFSADGRYAVFAGGAPGERRDLFVMELENGRPRSIELLAKLNSPFDEVAPAFRAGELYFASNRAVDTTPSPSAPGAGDPTRTSDTAANAAQAKPAAVAPNFDLYVADFANGTIGEPRRLPGSINTAADERDPAPLPDGSGIVFSANPVHGALRDFDLYLAEKDARGDYVVSHLTQLSSPRDDVDANVSSDGRMLVFASDKETAAGAPADFDLYRSLREGSSWRAAERIGGLASADSERAPRFLDDGFSLVFERRSAADPTLPHLLRARSIELFRVPGRPIGWMEILFIAALLATALLAWLAKRWEALDVLYKCFVVAFLVHLFAVLWSRRVPVEPDDVKLAPRETLFKVQVAAAKSRADAGRERGGRLDVARPEGGGTTSEQNGPERPESLAGSSGNAEMPSATPGSLALSRAARRLDPNDAAGGAGERQGSGAAEPGRAAVTEAQVALADRGAEGPRAATPAPGLDLGGPSRVAGERPSGGASGAAPSGPGRVVAATSDGGSAGGATRMPGLALARGDAVTAASPSRGAGGAGAAASGPVARPAGGSIDVALSDTEHFEPLATGIGSGGGTGELALGDPNVGTTGRDAGGGMASGPERASGLSGTAESSGTASGGGSGVDAPPTLGDFSFSSLNLKGGGGGPERAAIDFTPSAGTGGSGTAADGAGADVAIAGPRDGARPVANPALPPDHLTLDPVAFDSPGGGRGEGTGSGAGDGPARYGFTSGITADPIAAPAPLEFARAERGAGSNDAPSGPSGSGFEHTPYKTRFGLEKEVALEKGGGTAETERAVARGLAYLASQQADDGCFGSSETYDEKYGYVVVGKTSLCLLAFLGAGHTPISNTEHSTVTERAVRFLKEVQTENGHFGWTSAYSHGIATYALAECFALTKDESLRATIELAVKNILDNQSKSRDPRNAGGWGYFNPQGAHFDKWSRVSISAWQVMALESARLSGISVPDAAFEGAKQFLQNARDADYGYFRYNHDPDRLNSGYRTLPGSTPAAIFALALLGDDVAAADFAPARQFVLDRIPREYRWRGEDAFVEQATGNLYFWYYGSLAMFRIGGEPWERWNAGLKKVLPAAQARDGSWKPIDSYAEHAGDSESSRCYTTAMCVLTLEVYYRYFTPLLRVDPVRPAK